VEGVVEVVKFEEGQRLKRGHVLIKLRSDLLEKSLQAKQASYEQVLSDLEKANIDLKRAENLRKEELITEQSYDETRFNLKGLEKRAVSLKAEVGRLEVELQKKAIKAPFDGVVIKKHVDRGEWVAAGSTVATIANDEFVDIIPEVPETIIVYINEGEQVTVKARGEDFTGKVVALVPRGDIATRTFPVKIRIKNIMSLIEGMEARVTLPAGREEESLTVHRDAVITVFGNTVVYAVNDSKALMIPVKIIGYKGLTAGISAEGLKEGMKVVIKGNERLRDGQLVKIINSNLQAPNNK
jgi:RND family efflux transporter MFP subunit